MLPGAGEYRLDLLFPVSGSTTLILTLPRHSCEGFLVRSVRESLQS
ncbi:MULTISPECIES: hypothetical protein [unclassified Microcoleus]|nr:MULTISPECIES: hypothetical protein [unclassified Microcoleus]